MDYISKALKILREEGPKTLLVKSLKFFRYKIASWIKEQKMKLVRLRYGSTVEKKINGYKMILDAEDRGINSDLIINNV